MADSKYWLNFWKTNAIVNKPGAHEKVGRTINGIAIGEKEWLSVLRDLEMHLELKEDDVVLDIGAGSGVISIPFSQKVKSITAVDISPGLLMEMEQVPRIKTMEADARELVLEPGSFDKIIIYFAIQHFTEEETVRLIGKVFSWLKPGGLLYIGDIPDSDRKFSFFNTTERKAAYFNSLENATPIIGTWFQKDFFLHLGNYLGFRESRVVKQPDYFINAHYRFDVKYQK